MKFKHLLTMALLAIGVSNAWAQKDITSTYITNADLATNTSGWTKVGFGDPAKQTNSGTAVEAYAGWGALDLNNYSLTQSITLPAGSYRLTGSAFFRQGLNYNTDAAKSLAYLKAGSQQVKLTTLGSEKAKAYANSQAEAAGVLSAGMYVNSVDFTVATDGTVVEIGYVGTFDLKQSWCLVSGVKLYDMNEDPAGLDYSTKIVNPSFENGTTGWTVTGEWNEQSNTEAVKVGTRYIEKWQSSALGGLPDGKVSQVVTGLPNGKYKVTAVAIQTGTGSVVFANGTKINAPNTAAVLTLENIDVTDGTLEIGFAREGTTSNWVGVDNFRIYCTELDLEELKKLLNDAITEANGIITECGSLPFDASAITGPLNDAITAAALSATPSVREITGKTEALNTAIETAKAAKLQAEQEYTLANPTAGDDLTFALESTPASWHTTGVYQGSYTEKYVEEGLPAGKILYQHVEGLQPGKYQVKFIAVLNVARNLDNAVWAGDDKAYIFANNAQQYLTIGTNSGCTPTEAQYERTLTAIVGADGVLEYGIANKVPAGQWYVAQIISLKYLEDVVIEETTVTVSAAKYSTFIAPFDVAVPVGSEAFTVTDTDDKSVLVVESVGTLIPANTPVLVSAESPILHTTWGVNEASNASYTVGLLTGVFAPTSAPTGSYVLQKNNDVVAFYQVDSADPITVPAGKAYLSAPAGASEQRAFYFTEEGVQTAIEGLNALVNGNIKAIYTLDGKMVDSLQKGVNVIKLSNGKVQKVIVK